MDNAKQYSLKEFLEQNHILLSAMAVFVALAVFISGLPVKWLNSILLFVFIAGIIIILYEIQSNFPKEKQMSPRLFLFNYIIISGLWGIILYLLLIFRTFWQIFLFFPLFVLFFLTTHSTFKPLAKINFFIKIFGIGQKKNTIQGILEKIYWLLVTIFSALCAIVFTPLLNAILDFLNSL